MNSGIDLLVKTLLQKDSLGTCSLEELNRYARKYPYIGAAHLLVAKKLQLEEPALYPEQFRKSLLYFPEPLRADQLLNETGKAEIRKKATEEMTGEKSREAPETIPVLPPENTPESQVSLPEETTQHLNADETVAATPVPVISPAPAGELLFEPYHTVDYFASQGIRIRDEEKPADRLGKQLKSFTEWLKTCKKLPDTEIGKGVSQQAEQKVELMAGQSLAERDVITEAMAEVWEKQGNSLKAIEIYTKLSLLEPAKSPYFAAKIEALKEK